MMQWKNRLKLWWHEKQEGPLQPYIPGAEVHSEQVTSKFWNIFMVDVSGYPIMRNLSEEEAAKFVHNVNEQLKESKT